MAGKVYNGVHWKSLLLEIPFLDTKSPDRSSYNEIDYICFRRKWKSSLFDDRAYGEVEVMPKNYLLCENIKLKFKRIIKIVISETLRMKPSKLNFRSK